MTDNARMVDLPWVDGTTRTVPEWTVYEAADGRILYARKNGYSQRNRRYFSYHDEDSAAVRILTEAPEPPVKVTVPTGLGAIVSMAVYPNDPGYVLTRYGWRGLRTYDRYDPSEIADLLHKGARVLFEGVDEDTP